MSKKLLNLFIVYVLGSITIFFAFYFGISFFFPKFGDKSVKKPEKTVPVEIKVVKEVIIKRNFNYFSHNYKIERALREKHIHFKRNPEDFFSEIFYIWYVEELVRIASVLRSPILSPKTLMYNQRNAMDLVDFINANNNLRVLAGQPNIYGNASQARYRFMRSGNAQEIALKKSRADTALEVYMEHIS